ncbi:MAG: MmgE/PrpD family protein [Proteobacteria bacterium]|nr:MmgE/PrpD family protein [Pseudomonadota bacterium]MDA1057575.1 MmgE/PrpD family protein [Pseudomonadota bacterium]
MTSAAETFEEPTAAHDAPSFLSSRLARFALDLDLGAVPSAVVERAKLNILDCFGVGLAASTFDFGGVTLAGVHALAGDGDSPVIASGTRLPLRDAVLVNGTLIHGLDYDDTHADSVVHCSASALPVAFAVGLKHGASGATMMAAYLAGVEADARIGMGANGGFHKQGYHATGVVGAFGATLAAGRLMGLTEEQLVMAQGITLSTTSGALEFLEDGAWTKRMHPAWAGVGAITAAALAQGGFVGPRRAYEGRFGLYNVFAAHDVTTEPEKAVAGLNTDWELMNVAFKPYPACHFNHAFADAALALRAKYDLKPDDIAELVALIHEKQVPVVCEPEANKKKPANSYDAKFSVHYTMAASIVRGRFTLDELEDDALNDPTILDLCSKARYETDPTSLFPRYYGGEVLVRTKDGRELRHRETHNRGSDKNPLSTSDILGKFRSNASRVFDAARTEQVIEAVIRLDTASDLTGLAAALTR